jgi:MoxR-like ATPase
LLGALLGLGLLCSTPAAGAAENIVLVSGAFRRSIPVSDEVIRYAVRLVARTRPEDPSAPAYVKEFIRWGASPRASQYLILGAKARAATTGKLCADYEGVRYVARQVLRHRVNPNFNARAQKVTVETLIDRLLKEVPVQ